MISLFVTLMVVLGIALVLCWAVNKLAPDPFKTWGIVLIVVVAVFYAGATVLSQLGVHLGGSLSR